MSTLALTPPSYDRIAGTLIAAWQRLHAAHTVAVTRCEEQARRATEVAAHLGMTATEFIACRRRARHAHQPRTPAQKSQQTRFNRSPLARSWAVSMTRAEWSERDTRKRLAEAARSLVALAGYADAAALTGLSPAQVAGLCRVGARRAARPPTYR